MEISAQVRTVTQMLSEFAGGALHDDAMMQRFLQHAHDRGTPERLGELAFTGKYLSRLQNTIRQQQADNDLRSKLEQELSKAVHEFHAKVAAFVEDAGEDFRSMVQKHCLDVNEDALRGLLRLAQDFTWLKNWELEMSRHQADSGGGASED